MKFLITLCFLSLYLTFTTSKPIKIVQILTWDPEQSKTTSPNELLAHFEDSIKTSFIYGQSLAEQDQIGFYNQVTENSVKFFSPEYYYSYANLYAIYAGIMSFQDEKKLSDVQEEIKELKLKQVFEDDEIFVLDFPKQDLDNTFRVINTSLLLESSSFECPNKRKQINDNKQNIPSQVKKTCNLASEENNEATLTKIQDVMDLYKKLPKNKESPNLENCLEQFTFSTYYSNDVLVKLNSGKLLAELAEVLSSNDRSTELYVYMVSSETFLGVLTAIQKVFATQIKKGSTIGQRLYSGSLKNFDRKIVMEVTEGQDQENLKVLIQSGSRQKLFEMEFQMTAFIREIGPFMVTDFLNFKNLCGHVTNSVFNLKNVLLPEDGMKVFESLKPQFLFLLVIIAVVVVIIAINYKAPKVKTDKDNKNIEFKRIKSDEVDQESGIGMAGVKYRKQVPGSEDDSYSV